MPAPPPTSHSGRHRHPERRLPGRATLVGILASLVIMLGSGVGITLTSAAPGNDPADPTDAVTALGTAPTTTGPTPAATPTAEPASTPSPTATTEPEPAPPEPEPEPEPAPAPAAPEPADEITAFEDEVTTITNTERAAAGCPAVSTDERLRTAARGHSQDMAANDYFSHTGQDGRSPFDRMSDAGYPNGAGENIAMGYRTPADVMDGWMNSEGHRNNLLTCSHTAIGVGLAYDGNGRPYWTQVFGR